ncbi:NAD(P)H-hydrate repair Nnr-like enzyme with NAD(P)H-hydrate dehydratase domain [Bradyrhizobium diazoefficiens]
MQPRPARARLAARGALRAGAGLVTLASPRDALAINAAALTAVMVRPVDTAIEFGELLGDKRYNTCIIGPGTGVGDRTCDFVHTALGAQRHLVLDADALTSFAANPERLFESIKASHDNAVVLTPHEGEFPRLFSDLSNKHPGRSKLERVRAAAERSGAVVLLKGPDTTIAAPDGARHHRRQCAALARHGGCGRRALRHHRGAPGAGRAGLRSRQHRRVDAWRGGKRGGAGADRGGPDRDPAGRAPADL